jgi:H+/Cl- antiporter ClcA
MNNALQPVAGKLNTNLRKETHWSSVISLWTAAALLGSVTSLLVWAFMKGFGWLNSLTLGTFGALPAPTGQIATALIPAIGGLLVAFLMHTWFHPDKLAAMAHVINGVTAQGGKLNYFNGFIFILGSLIGIGFGGVLFAMPTLIAVAFSALVTFWLSGAPVQYAIPAGGRAWNWTLLLQISAALLAALAAIMYVNLLPTLKKFWTSVKMPFWAKAGLAGLMVGIAGIWLPDIFGTGLSQMKTIFDGNIYPFSILIAQLIGSALGAAYGLLLVWLIPGTTLSPVVFAMIATAAMLAGMFHVPLFGAMMIFKMSGNYEQLLPLLFAAAIRYGVAKPFQPGSAYTFAFKPLGVTFIPGTFQEEQHPAGKQYSTRNKIKQPTRLAATT